MARYLGVTAVVEKGEPIGPLIERKPQIPTGKRLIGVANNGSWIIAPDITLDREYYDLYSICTKGIWRECFLYLLDEEQASQCPDRGLVNRSLQ